MSLRSTTRLAYIDWMRGLACLVMFQTHCYDAWLNADARKSTFFMWSQLGGTLPAPLFLFLAGISVALVVDRSCQKGIPTPAIAKSIIHRGAEVLGLGLLLRLQEFLISWGWAPWSDLLRVDVLNTIGLSMILMGCLCWAALRTTAKTRWTSIASASGACLVIALLTPMLWTVWRPRWLPWPLESYINGVHNLGEPQPWLFPVFPWAAFGFAGLAVGLLLRGTWARRHEVVFFLLAGASGTALIYGSRWLDALPWHLYPVYDYWHTSPNFFLLRVGLLLIIMLTGFAWCRWGAGQRGFGPLVQLGNTSLLVYWVHIEFVYGRVSILPKRSQTILSATIGLAIIFVAMLGLSVLQTRMKGRWTQMFRRSPIQPNPGEVGKQQT